MTRFAFVNFLTFVRAPLAFLAALATLANLAAPSWWWIGATATLLFLSAVTDLLDGKLARRWGVTSRLGALADPLMDKVFYVVTLPTATFAALWMGDTVHACVLLALDVVSMARDLWVTFLRAAASGTAAKMAAGMVGKVRTALALPVIAFVHVALGIRRLAIAEVTTLTVPREILFALEGLLLVLTVYSGAAYTRYYLPYLRESGRKEA